MIGHVLTSLCSKRARFLDACARRATLRAVCLTSLLWAVSVAGAIEVADVNLADLSHYAADSLHNEAAWAVDLQSVDLRLVAKQREAEALEKEIEALDRKIDVHDRVLELSRDPDINK